MTTKCMTTNKSLPPSSSCESKFDRETTREHCLPFGGSEEAVVPENFIWPEELRAKESVPELHVPHIDLQKFLSGNERDVEEVTTLVDEACRKHGFFLLVNHGVDMEFMNKVHEYTKEFFALPLDVKQRVPKKPGTTYGYAYSFVGRFPNKLPWTETLSLRYLARENLPISQNDICDHFCQEFPQYAKVYQEYGNTMNDLCMKILELLGLSLGISSEHFKKFYEDNDSIMGFNYYPPCKKPELTMGSGPHSDPTSITILHQDHVSGLQVYFDDQWQSIPPNHGSFVVNIGDTFMSLTNGVYKSCLHRVVVNSKEARKSLGFFLCPAVDKVVRAPEELVEKNPPRKFPDYTWPTLLKMIQKFYRADCNTFESFPTWLEQQKLDTGSSFAPSDV